MSTLLYTHPLFREHKTGAHPEKPLRLEKIETQLNDSGLAKRCQRVAEWSPASRERILRNHTAEHLDYVKHFVDEGGGQIESDTIVSEKSYDASVLAAGAVCDAVEKVVGGKASNALCLVRPPGHHAVRKSAMGFCLFNSIAIAAHMAVAELKLDRVLVIDWDVHHGNGTQDSFYEDGRVGFFSIHRYPFYPGSGAADETGKGRGLGMIRNLPIKFGTSRNDIHAQFEKELTDFASRVKPQLILLSAGFDAHRQDPIGSIGLESQDFSRWSDVVLGIAKEHCDRKLVSTLEGGYNVDRLAESVGLHVERLLAHAP